MQQLESWISESAATQSASPYQLHSAWLAQRKAPAGLLAEYVASALRPTGAFPHVVLLLAVLLLGAIPS